MTVRPLRDRRYVVETDGGTYVVDVERGRCTCPDHAIRGARCKHLRRVAIEITERRVPAPHERRSVCAVCGDETFVPFDAQGPQLCGRHDLAAGDLVRDRETDALLVVVRATGDRADESVTRENRVVAAYETNRHYGDHEPVFEARYLDADPVGAEDVEAGVDTDGLAGGVDSLGSGTLPRGPERRETRLRGTTYRFPASRLKPVQRGYLSPAALGVDVDTDAGRTLTAVQG